jgi:hypothetical protein
MSNAPGAVILSEAKDLLLRKKQIPRWENQQQFLRSAQDSLGSARDDKWKAGPSRCSG